MCDIVGKGDCALRTKFCTKPAADAAGTAHIPNLFPLFLRETANHILRIVGNQFDQVLGTDRNTFSAAVAVLF